jgi:hypothetical protein
MGHANILVFMALYGWIPLILGMFAFLPPRRAAIYGFLIAWLFLPMYVIPLHPFTEYNKMSAASFGVLLSALIFDSGTVFAFRPSIWDLPMAVWCFCPFISSVCNGLGPYDGLASTVSQIVAFGLPYFIGRIYFNDLQGLRELATGLIIGGLVYVPLCLFEIRFSPQLHRMIYGYYQWEFGQSKRYGGFRPMVFMQHGLAVAMWMVGTTLTCFWMLWSGFRGRLLGIPLNIAFLALLITTLLCHSVGALAFLFLGFAGLALIRRTKSPVWVLLLALMPPTYMYLRIYNIWTGDAMVAKLMKIDERGAHSVAIRLRNERLFVDKALQHPIYGWAGWNRFQVQDEQGRIIGVPDGMWIIALGHYGLIGLISLTTALTLPMLLMAWKIPVRYWAHPGAAPAAVLAVLIGLHMCDNLLNAMVNPIFVLCAGGICGLRFSLRSPVADAALQRLPMPILAVAAPAQA